MKKLLVLLLFAANVIAAQDVPVPAPKQNRPIIIKNARIHIGNGTVLEKSDILFDQGKIKEVGNVTVPANAQVIDAAGKEVYPGIIAPTTRLGLSEIEAARATLDFEEVGSTNPNARALVAYNTDSHVTPTVRANGVLTAQILPEGGTLAGTTSIVQLDAWNWEDAVLKKDEGIYIQWPSMVFSTSPSAQPMDVQKKNSEAAIRNLMQTMDDAKAYSVAKDAGKITEIDQRWEAMVPVFKKQKTVYINASNVKAIEAAVAFIRNYDVKAAIVNGFDSWMVTNLLKENQIPVIIGETHSIPSRDDEDADLRYKLPKLLKDGGVKFCLSMGGSWQQRNLMFMAGTAAGFGLTKEEALSAITKDAADILGISDRVGTIEKGKDATLIISGGDILDMRTSKVEAAFIEGRSIDLGNKQLDLYKKFKDKYGAQ